MTPGSDRGEDRRPSEPDWQRGDVVRDAEGVVWQRNSRYIDPKHVWRNFSGDWRSDERVPRPLVRLVPETTENGPEATPW